MAVILIYVNCNVFAGKLADKLSYAMLDVFSTSVNYEL